MLLVPDAIDACERDNWELFDQILEDIKDLIQIPLSNLGTTLTGDPANLIPVFFEDEQVDLFLETTRTKTKARDAVLVDGQLYTTDSAANAGAGTTANQVTHILATDPSAIEFHTYKIQSGSEIEIQSPYGSATLNLNGSIEISDFQTLPNGDKRAVVSSGTIVGSIAGEGADFHVNSASPLNEVIIDAQGVGELQLIGRFSGTGIFDVDDMYNDSVLVLPISFTANQDAFAVATVGLVDGTTIAPVAEFSWTPPAGSHSGCQDTDGDGVLDFAETLKQSIEGAITDLCN